jgi:hypothetical protein
MMSATSQIGAFNGLPQIEVTREYLASRNLRVAGEPDLLNNLLGECPSGGRFWFRDRLEVRAVLRMEAPE